MILLKIELNNFRSYYGIQIVDLSRCAASNDRNIVAVGGLNGAGKTSLLEGITYALLGVQDAFTFIEATERKGEGRDRLERTLNGLLNREARTEGEREAKVLLFFRDHDGSIFTVQRTWQYDHQGKYKNEELLVTTKHDVLGPDQYEDFIKNRIPREVARFFFFDGEKIQEIAQDEVGKEVLNGIDSLLGFHLLDALTTDMDTLQDNYRKQAKKRNRLDEELTDLQGKKTRLANQIAELEDEKTECEENVHRLKEKSRQLVDELNSVLGSTEGTGPKELDRQLNETNENIRRLKEQILDDVDRGVVPALPTELLVALSSQIDGEEKRLQWEEGKRRVEPQRNRLLERVFSDAAPTPAPPLSISQSRFLCDRIRDEWDDLFNPPPEGIAATVIHSYLSDTERAQVRAKCLQVMRSGALDIRSKLDRLDTAERKARDLRQQLERIGDGEGRLRVNKIIDDKAQVDKELGEAEQAWGVHDRKIQSLRTDLRETSRNIENKEQDIDRSGTSDAKASFVRMVKRALQQYKDKLRPRKRDEVARHLTEMYRLLARKEDVVERIELDEKTYRPHLLDRRGKVMPLHSLSAGEREIYALSLLWALGMTSNRKLPVIIDTPLARLDSEHRSSIVKKYLPAAGPQVIVLSTDTELDMTNFELVRDKIATTVYLDFDPATERTSVREGFFDFA